MAWSEAGVRKRLHPATQRPDYVVPTQGGIIPGKESALMRLTLRTLIYHLEQPR